MMEPIGAYLNENDRTSCFVRSDRIVWYIDLYIRKTREHEQRNPKSIERPPTID